jgi:phytoene desaturase
MKTCGVIGSGFSGLAAASCLAKAGYKVTILEKNDSIGGRARQYITDGFTFDMGPSWYWMPEVFEEFYERFGYTTSDFYELKRLDPSYKVVFGQDDELDIPSNYSEYKALFEQLEPGSGEKLDKFLEEAAYKYKVGMNEFVWKPGLSVTEFFDWRVVKSVFKLQMLSSIGSQVDKLFKDEKIRQILKFPVLFLGATPEDTPALYSLMNYADIKLGTWYPMGGMFKIVEAFEKIAIEQGVEIITDAEVKSIETQNSLVSSVVTTKGTFNFDYVVGSADYHHIDQHLLNTNDRSYSEQYWSKRTMAPSSLLFYIGLDTKLSGFDHHNLFFHTDFGLHAHEIYKDPSWPSDPLFYICIPSITDVNVAPKNCENVFILMPIATALEDNDEIREKYFNMICDQILKIKGIDIRSHIIYKRSYCVNDFKNDYNAFGGNAYGLANTLKQTAILKPRLKHPTIQNMYFAGQLTNPGPGVPPSIISGQVVADLIIKSDPGYSVHQKDVLHITSKT